MLAPLLALAITATPTDGAILLDARCDEPAWQSATRADIGNGLTLRSMADDEYVYLCVPLPPESLGTLDLYVETSDGAQTNLHVSAQTGERTRTPQGWPEWAGFNNYYGWYGPPVAFGGFTRSADGQLQPTFANSAAREVQISRARFGDGPWRIMLQVNALGADRAGNVTFPAGADADNAATWARFELS